MLKIPTPTIKTQCANLTIVLWMMGAVTVGHLSSNIFILASLFGIGLLVAGKRGLISREQKIFQWVCLSFWAVALLSYVVESLNYQGFKEIGRYLRIVMFVPLIVTLNYFRPQPKAFWFSIIAAGFTLCAVAVYQYLSLNMPRSGGATNPILFGSFAALITTFSLLAAVFFKKQTWLALLCLVASGCALTAVILSGSRNAMFATALIILLATWLFFDKHKHWVSLIIVFSLLIGTSVTHQLWPDNPVSKRIHYIYTDTQGYHSGTDTNNPIGLRFDLWKAAWDMFKEKPVLGKGLGSFHENIKQRVDRGESPEHLGQLNQAHNSSLHILATRGFLGLMSLLALLGVPLVYFYSQLKSSVAHTRIIPTAAICTVIAYVLFGLTESIFSRSIMLNTYVALMGFFYFFQQRPANSR